MRSKRGVTGNTFVEGVVSSVEGLCRNVNARRQLSYRFVRTPEPRQDKPAEAGIMQQVFHP